ncbi:MAG: endonuclease/exonuclease/phosphatase family protein [Ruminococcus sp.]|nr:endonuclease/exonuclease/phosphatase family protein [Ruminococcus sp.]
MKIVFWNLYKKENSNHIRNLLIENNIDIAVFAEYEGLNISRLKNDNPEYLIAENMDICDRLLFVYKNEIKHTIRQEQYYYAIHSFSINEKLYIIVGLHLPSNTHSKSEDGKEEIPHLINDLIEIESKYKTENTLIIGDFNANPFDSELILAYCIVEN